MYNELALKYFSSRERHEIRMEAKNLCKDIAFFEEYMDRFKKTNFELKVSFYKNSSQESIKRLFQKNEGHKLDEHDIAGLLLQYNLVRFFVNQIELEKVTDEMEIDIAKFSNYWSDSYGDNGIVDYISDFIDCSGSTDAITREINTMVKNFEINNLQKAKVPAFKDENFSLKELKEFIEKEIDFDNMVVNSGLYETKPVAKHLDYDGIDDITIGVCFENSKAIGGPYELSDGTELEEFYTYNIFVGPEYVNIFGDAVGSVEDRLPESTLILIKEAILDYADFEALED